MRTRRLLIGLAAATLLPLMVPSPAPAAGPAAVAVPGSWLTNYATPVLTAQQGGELTLINGDLQRHDVVSVQTGPNTQPWCGLLAEWQDACPLFWSELIGIGTTPVLGLENLVPATVYDFYCTIHLNMKGKLVALPG